MRIGRRTEHSFHCIKCGKAGIPLARQDSFKREKFHRKKLYCPWCKITVNHVECKNASEVYEFLEDFENGVYVDEAEESISYVGASCLG